MHRILELPHASGVAGLGAGLRQSFAARTDFYGGTIMGKTGVAKTLAVVAALVMAAPLAGTVPGVHYGTAAAGCTKWKNYLLFFANDGGAVCLGQGTGCQVCIEQT